VSDFNLSISGKRGKNMRGLFRWASIEREEDEIGNKKREDEGAVA
jgi:hypothetical protein